MAAAPGVGDAVTPGEYPAAYLRWLAQNTPGAGGSWQVSEPSLVQQVAAPVEGASEATIPELLAGAGMGGRMSGLKDILAAAKEVRPFGAGGGMPVTDFVGGLPGLVRGIGVPLAIGAGSQLGAHALQGSEFGKIHPDAAPALSTIGGMAATGAGLGTFFGPEGTVIGGLAGGIAGGLKTLFSKPHQSVGQQLTDAEGHVWGALGGLGVPAKTIQAVQDEYNMLKSTQGQQAALGYLNQVYQYQQQNSTQTLPGLAPAGGASSQIMALQSQLGKLVAPYYQDMSKQSNAEIQAYMRAATPAGQKISDATQNLGAMYQKSNNEITDAYILQAQGEPLLDQMASSYYNKGLVASQPGGGGGSLADLLTGNPGAAGTSSGTATQGSAPLATNYGGASPLLLQ